MRRREFTAGLLLASAVPTVRAEEPAKQHRIAIIRPAGPVSIMTDTGYPFWRAFFEELRRLGDVEGENLTVERYSGEGRPEDFADLARDVVGRNPDVTVALGEAVARAARAANGSMPIVWTGGADPIEAGLATSLAHPGGNITGVTAYPGAEIWGKRLQILKDTVPSASKIAYLDVRLDQSAAGQEERRKASERLQISLIYALLEEPTASEVQRVIAEITQERVAILPSFALPLLQRELPSVYPAQFLERFGCGPLMIEQPSSGVTRRGRRSLFFSDPRTTAGPLRPRSSY